jgi:sugar phosphate isomerase/epimerase
MRLGIEAGPHTTAAAIELGVGGVPIAAEALVRDGVEATLAPLRAQGLSVCQIGAFGFNPLALDPGQADVLERAIPLAAATGCPYIVINGGNYHPSGFLAADARNFTEAALDRVAEVLAPFVKLAERHGARLSIEAYLKTAVCSPERFLALYEKLGSAALVANVDVTSLYDFWDLVDPSAKVTHVCSALAGHYGLLHLKEVALSEGFHLHAGLAPLGAGTTAWEQVLRLSAPHLPADSWAIVEHVSSLDEARQSIALLRQAAAATGVTLT